MAVRSGLCRMQLSGATASSAACADSGIDSDLWSLESIFVCEECRSSSVLPAWGEVT